MNVPLALMLGVALLLVGGCCKGKWSVLHKWAGIACAVVLAIQPVEALLKWLGKLVGIGA